MSIDLRGHEFEAVVPRNSHFHERCTQCGKEFELTLGVKAASQAGQGGGNSIRKAVELVLHDMGPCANPKA